MTFIKFVGVLLGTVFGGQIVMAFLGWNDPAEQAAGIGFATFVAGAIALTIHHATEGK